MNYPQDFSEDQLLELLDIATNALEEILRDARGSKTIATEALENIAHLSMDWMNSE